MTENRTNTILQKYQALVNTFLSYTKADLKTQPIRQAAEAQAREIIKAANTVYSKPNGNEKVALAILLPALDRIPQQTKNRSLRFLSYDISLSLVNKFSELIPTEHKQPKALIKKCKFVITELRRFSLFPDSKRSKDQKAADSQKILELQKKITELQAERKREKRIINIQNKNIFSPFDTKMAWPKLNIQPLYTTKRRRGRKRRLEKTEKNTVTEITTGLKKMKLN